MASNIYSEYLSSLFGLKGKTALVTSGTRGIGRGLAIALASAGADIVLLARHPSGPTVTSTASAIRALGCQCHIYACDLSSRSNILAIIPLVCIQDRHDIDILVHSGGIQHRAPASNFPIEKWDDILSVNLTAGFLLSQQFAQHWLSTSLAHSTEPVAGLSISEKRKKVIFIASIIIWSGSLQIPAYVATKGALASLTRALKNEWMGNGINVNAIAPGYIETELTQGIRNDGEKERMVLERVPAGRWGLPDDLAGAVIHLAGKGSDFVGGEVYAVDGGFNGRDLL